MSPIVQGTHQVPTLGFAISGGLGLDARTEVDLAVKAIDDGFEPVFITEVAGATATSVAAAVAAKRPHHVLATGIVPLGSRTNAALAMEARSIAAISQHAFLLGVGVSTRQIVSDWHGAERRATVADTRSAIADLRAILAGERRGSFRLPDAGDVPIRILLGALGPRMIELACTIGDGTILTLTPSDAVPPLHGTESYVYMWVRVLDDGDVQTRREVTSYAMAAPYARHFANLGYGTMVDQIHRLHAEGRLRDAPDVVPVELLDRLYVDPRDITLRAKEYIAAGVVPVVMPVTGPNPVRDIQRLLS